MAKHTNMLAQAVAHHQAGRPAEAERGYREVLAADPRNADALHLLGVLALQSGRAEEAVTLIGKALAQAKGVADYWDNLGSALSAAGRPDDAAQAHRNATILDPQGAQRRHNMGNALAALGRHDEAQRAFATALALKPDYAKAWYNLGNGHAVRHRYADAVTALDRAVRLAPGMVEAHNNLGDALAMAGRLEEAVAQHRLVTRHRPDDATAFYNLGAVLQQKGALESAEIAYRQALKRNPRHSAALNNLGSVLKRLGRPDQAELCHRQALELHPEFVEARYNLGNALQAQGRYEEATACFEEALAQQPDLATATYNLSLLALLHGDLSRGWAGYERRFAAGEAMPNRHFPIPRWGGELLRGKRLLVWREQGVGDEVMFASCYADVIAWAGGPITIECDPRLVPLFRRSFPNATVRAESCTGDAFGGNPREMIDPIDCDLQVAAGDLPELLRGSLSAFEPQGSWLVPNPALVKRWAERLAALGPGLRVGIGWRSQLMTADRKAAYVMLEHWGPLFAVPGVVFVNLQYGDCEAELRAAEERFGVTIHRWADLNLKDDFDGAAALAANLDLVISPAMSAGELAGALGVPVWRFGTRDWTQLGTGIRPWFPTMRLFQPSPGAGLDSTVGAMAKALHGMMPEPLPVAAVQGSAEPEQRIDFDALLNRAADLHRAGRLEEAEAAYRTAIAAAPRHEAPGLPDALHLLGLLMHQTGRNEKALALIGEALRIDPNFPQAWNHLGLVHEMEKRHAESSYAFARALALHPAYPEALTHLGLVHQMGGRVREAVRLHRRAIAIQPDHPPAHANLGHARELGGQTAEATDHYRRALALQPESAEANNNLATMATLAGQLEEAKSHLRRALRVDSGFALAAWNLGLMDLADGRIMEGWAGYSRRFSARQLQRARRIDRPVWTGEALQGRRLLVWSEQGVGDEILFASCFDALNGLDGPVTVESDRRLVSLFARSFPWMAVRAETVDPNGRETIDPPDCDLQMPAGNLPALVRDGVARYPHRPAYLRPDPDLVTRWRDRLATLPGLKVGLAWRSQIVTAQRAAAYTGLADWTALLDLPGVSVVMLQYGDCAAELARVETATRRLHRWDDLNLKDDFEAVSALIANLDLVISPATAVGELAGALGTPVWRLGTRDWTQMGTGIRPWFPSMRLIQPPEGQGLADAARQAVRTLAALVPTG
ncbi:tetratricopeptide (TPR) repeat protein [Azospirillum lipoferum]|uniref:Tetratricopeptide repeat protein n=1 Tax=Azospirillum lipoferum TaxID=193 RepID=A0A5A9GDQ5_AZOLI|nr:MULTISPECIES: tetratricopeptide repeat protein [Azospirillum]KAA0592546.1 tetratricopeptide repeat protein [Azospirillum lipoferum]MCP1614465.1 tetratricopeptide (TPR) repeat protein [Azospirillum lipoferum]MDW5532703.1 tetratricopeptide repeat protein [Azospirillum sp. NL1]